MHRTKGIVIKKENFREVDEIITVLSQEFGKISVLSRGGKKPSAKLTGHLQLFDLAEIMFVQGRKIKTVTSAVSLPSFKNIKKDFDKAVFAANVAKLADNLIMFEEPDKKIWKIFLGIFRFVDGQKLTAAQLRMAFSYFQFWLLSYLGFEPDFGAAKDEIKKIIDFFKLNQMPLSGFSEMSLKLVEDFLNRSVDVACAGLDVSWLD